MNRASLSGLEYDVAALIVGPKREKVALFSDRSVLYKGNP